MWVKIAFLGEIWPVIIYLGPLSERLTLGIVPQVILNHILYIHYKLPLLLS